MAALLVCLLCTAAVIAETTVWAYRTDSSRGEVAKVHSAL
jgi:hypothetical protein